MYNNEETEVLSPITDINITDLGDTLEKEKSNARIEELERKIKYYDELFANKGLTTRENIENQEQTLYELSGKARVRLPQDFRNGFVHPVLLAVMTALFGILFITMIF